MARSLVVALALAAAVLGGVGARPALALTVVDLGRADDYTLLAAHGGAGARSGLLKLGSASEVAGDVGGRTFVQLGAGTHIDGFVHGGTPSFGPNVTFDGFTMLPEPDWSEIFADMVAASQAAAAAALSGTSIPAIAGTTTLTRTGDVTVYDVQGGIALAPGATLTISGQPGDCFIVNLSGDIAMGQDTAILLEGGVLGENVLFNIVGGDIDVGAVIVDGGLAGSELNGTFLTPNRYWIVGDGVTIHARILAGGIEGNFQTVEPPTTAIPEPGTLSLVAVSVLMAALRRKRKASG